MTAQPPSPAQELDPAIAGRCVSCAHWSPPTSRTGFDHLFSDTGDVWYGHCEAITLADSYENPPEPLPLAVTKDGSDYRAELYTQAEFGCAMWEPLGTAALAAQTGTGDGA